MNYKCCTNQGHILTNFYIIAFLLRHSDKFSNVHSVTIKMLCNHKSNYWTLEVFNLIPNICQFFYVSQFHGWKYAWPYSSERKRLPLSSVNVSVSTLASPRISPVSVSVAIPVENDYI